MLESQAHLAEGKAQLAKATSRREVLEAEAQLKRAQSDVEVAQSVSALGHLSDAAGSTRNVLMLRTSYSICSHLWQSCRPRSYPWSVI